MSTKKPAGKYSTAEARWAGVGPYYAMFPTPFADEVVEEYTQPGDAVLDPFAGRGTAIYSAAIRNRNAIGIEINPVGYVYANAKLKPGDHAAVVQRLHKLAEIAPNFRETADNLPPFFHHCFATQVREFLIAARDTLNWRKSKTDRTLMALILISLHGKRGQSLSNQMRQMTAMAPDYSIRWWKEKNLTPPTIDPVAFIEKRIKWRYVHGKPQTSDAAVFLSDSIKKLPYLARQAEEHLRPKAKLLVTSPPYHNVTNYYYDHWIRLWLLGMPEHPRQESNRYGGKFSNQERYRQLLRQVFVRAKPLLTEDAIIYVRTDRRKSTLDATLAILEEVFPEKTTAKEQRPLTPDRQARPYGRGGAPKQPNCEMDLILTPR